MKVSASTSPAANHVGGALLTSEQAAKYLGFTDGWLAELRMRGGGPKYLRLGRKCRYAGPIWTHGLRLTVSALPAKKAKLSAKAGHEKTANVASAGGLTLFPFHRPCLPISRV